MGMLHARPLCVVMLHAGHLGYIIFEAPLVQLEADELASSVHWLGDSWQQTALAPIRVPSI